MKWFLIFIGEVTMRVNMSNFIMCDSFTLRNLHSTYCSVPVFMELNCLILMMITRMIYTLHGGNAQGAFSVFPIPRITVSFLG